MVGWFCTMRSLTPITKVPSCPPLRRASTTADMGTTQIAPHTHTIAKRTIPTNTLFPENQMDLQIADRACIPATEVIEVLNSLSDTLIFNTANSQERLALASRLRHWVVADGTYLIREGDGDRNRSAIFMIGK